MPSPPRRYRDTDKRDVDREGSLNAGPSRANVGDALSAATPTPSGVLLEEEQTRAVLAAMERLPADYRQVLLLRHQEERSFEEIAQVMGRSANAVHKLWVRAVERMQQELDSFASPGAGSGTAAGPPRSFLQDGGVAGLLTGWLQDFPSRETCPINELYAIRVPLFLRLYLQQLAGRPGPSGGTRRERRRACA